MQFTYSADKTAVAFSGEFVFTDHKVFRDIATHLAQTAAAAPVAIDCAGLEFIDSAGLGMLLIARDEIGRVGRKLILRGAKGQVKRMFDISRFDTLFAIEP